MFLLEFLSDVFLPEPRDWQRERVVSYARWRAHRRPRGCLIICLAWAILIGWFVLGATLPDWHVTLYNTKTPPAPEIAGMARLGDLLAQARRSGDDSPTARASRTVLYKRLHTLEAQYGKDRTK